VTVGWAFAEQPYLLPGRLTLEEAAAAEEALSALLVSVGVGLALVEPSLEDEAVEQSERRHEQH